MRIQGFSWAPKPILPTGESLSRTRRVGMAAGRRGKPRAKMPVFLLGRFQFLIQFSNLNLPRPAAIPRLFKPGKPR